MTEIDESNTACCEKQVLLFSVGEEWYALDLIQVRGIVPVDEITPVPGADERIVGVQDLRGRLLAILDTASLLGLPPLSDAAHVIVLHHNGVECGCLVRRAEDIVTLRDDQWQEPLATLDEAKRLVLAQTCLDDHLVGLLDASAVLREVTMP